MKPTVCEYLLGNSLSSLEDSHGVEHSISTNRRKVSLNYSITADDGDVLARQCRGLVLARSDGGEISASDVFGESVVLAWPFDRFFNLGSGHAAPVDFSDPETRCYEKLDGTLIIVYHDPEMGWCTATRRNPDGDQSIADNPWEPQSVPVSFRDLFIRAWGETFEEPFDVASQSLNRALTFCFELTSPENRVVVDYREPRVSLLGARNTSLGLELPMGEMDASDWLCASCPSSQAQASPRAVLQLELAGRLADVLPILPASHATRAARLVSGLADLDAHVRATCAAARAVSSSEPCDKARRKAYAMEVQRIGAPMGPCMSAFDGRTAGMIEWARSRERDGAIPPSILDQIVAEIGTIEKEEKDE